MSVANPPHHARRRHTRALPAMPLAAVFSLAVAASLVAATTAADACVDECFVNSDLSPDCRFQCFYPAVYHAHTALCFTSDTDTLISAHFPRCFACVLRVCLCACVCVFAPLTAPCVRSSCVPHVSTHKIAPSPRLHCVYRATPPHAPPSTGCVRHSPAHHSACNCVTARYVRRRNPSRPLRTQLGGAFAPPLIVQSVTIRVLFRGSTVFTGL